MTHPLPEFDNPPVIEVALSVQFDELELLRIPQLGCVWQEFRERFPLTEEQPPLEPTSEQFPSATGGRPGVRLELSSQPLRPRLWFLNESGSELVQVQHDRFIRNWRKRANSGEYPRYERLRRLFVDDFEAFRRLVQGQEWGSIEPNQCEVTYVNIIPVDDDWQDHGDLAHLLTVFTRGHTVDQLGKPEEAAVNLKYVLKDSHDQPVGRLHIAANLVFQVSDNRPAIRLNLTARGQPQSSETEGVMKFLDRGHEAIVRGFASITTAEMHKVWKRTA